MSIQRTVRLLRGDEFALGDLPIFVNRSVESYELSEHRHDFLEISYVSEGTGTHYTGKASLSTGQGDIFLIPVGVSHVFRPASTAKNRPLVVYNCIITMEAAARLLETFPGGTELKPLLECTEIRGFRDRYGEFHRLFQRLHYDYASSRPGREAALYTGVMNLLLYLYRSGANKQETAAAAVSAGMEEVLKRIHTRFEHPLKVSELAGILGIGERQFHRLFTKQTGMTPTEYLQNVRVHEACRLLQTTDRKVSDIAPSVGYQDIAFFNALFKKKTGVSPREYRRKAIYE